MHLIERSLFLTALTFMSVSGWAFPVHFLLTCGVCLVNLSCCGTFFIFISATELGCPNSLHCYCASFNIFLSLSFSQDQFDNLEKHTQWGIDFVEKYTKFVKERTEIELNYARQIR